MNLPHHRTIRERNELEIASRTQAFRHAVLLALVFATLLLTGILNGCAPVETRGYYCFVTVEAGSEKEAQGRCMKLALATNELDTPAMQKAICDAGADTEVCK